MDGSHCEQSLNAPASSLIDEFTSLPAIHNVPAVVKPAPGRPKGSKNKSGSAEDASDTPAKRRGHPPGTGDLQRALAERLAAGEQDSTPEPSARPKNNLGDVSIPTPRPVAPSVLPVTTASSSIPAPASIPPPATTRRIIPEVNPSNDIAIPEGDDTYSRFLNDGVGDDDEEDDDEPDQDGIVDDTDPTTRPVNSEGDPIPPKPRRTARPLPSWLQTPFLAKLNESSNRGKDNLPPLYRDHQTFWFPETDPYFSMQKLDSSLDPQKLYRARFFLWDPAILVPHGIPCPNCDQRLHRHGHVPWPRRCVDLDHTFYDYIIGYRYRCPSCVNPQSKLKTITFRSWDSRIISKLSRAPAASFPAILIYRRGLSENVLMFMRSCFQSGMGAKQFADALRVRHLEQYDKLHISHLSTLAERIYGAIYGTEVLPFEDRSDDGFHGFLPSSQWLRDVFDKFVEEHGHEYDQHTALLSAYIAAIDHSFKLAKHIAKINGEQIFIALLTVTNELGEIRICNLVATKSHSQFELALNRMRESLERYGHDQPAIFYTDNMADKDFLKISSGEYPHLDTLKIPSSVRTRILDTVADTAMGSILHDLPDTNSKEKLVIFVDSEWNVETSAQGYVTGRGQTAILQIAYKDHIYILQIGKMLSGASLPKILIQLRTIPRVLKVGRSVDADLKYLQETIQSKAPFVGGVDLAKLAKERLLVSSAKIGLADLCATILERRLNKNVSERLSTAWDREQLTEPQSVRTYRMIASNTTLARTLGPAVKNSPMVIEVGTNLRR
ncbi:hypothetical protein C8R45DRAFT_1179980 [Mycena sanguinolenta]|nr:hypothetical protein C8R45DRAFT_1179980 [Mycena sanguinolenta]